MKRRMTILACSVFFFTASSWVSSAVLLGTSSYAGSAGGSGVFNELECGFGEAYHSGDGEFYPGLQLLSWTVSLEDIGKTLYIFPEMDSDYNYMSSLLTNGVTDHLTYFIQNVAYVQPDNLLSGQNVDFVGHSVDSISLTVNNMTFQHVGNVVYPFTDYTYDVTFSFWEGQVPEPTTIILLGLSGLILRSKK